MMMVDGLFTERIKNGVHQNFLSISSIERITQIMANFNVHLVWKSLYWNWKGQNKGINDEKRNNKGMRSNGTKEKVRSYFRFI